MTAYNTESHFVGMFVAKTTESDESVEASRASKGISYICRNCSHELIFAKGKIKRPHFKHKKGSDCAYSVGETWQHEEAKAVVVEALRDRGLDAFLEVPVLSIDGDRRADVLIYAPQSEKPRSDAERRMAIEVQYSPIDRSNLQKRTAAYMAEEIPVVWVPIIDAEKFKIVSSIDGTNLFKISEYSVPSWVSDIAAMQGHLWIYVPQSKAFWKGWLLPDWRWKEQKDWYDSDGNSNSSGGYWYEAIRTRDLFLKGPYQFGQLKIFRRSPKGSSKMNCSGDLKKFLDFMAPDAEKMTPRPVKKLRSSSIANGDGDGYYHYVDWVMIDGNWIKADFKPMGRLPHIEAGLICEGAPINILAVPQK